MSDNLPVAPDEIYWKQDPLDGSWIPPLRQERFLQWLTTPKSLRDYPTQIAYSQGEGVPMDTLKVWKRDQRFQNELWKRARKTLVDPQVLIDIFHYVSSAALDEDRPDNVRYKFVRTYLELVGEIGQGSGQNVWVNVFQTPVDQLSEQELEAQLAALQAEKNTIDGELVE